MNNLANAWRNARKGKIKKDYVIEFEKNIRQNLLELRRSLLIMNYSPKPLVSFILRDPKTRKISKSAFIDRIVHHALVRVIEPVFDKTFICDSCANRKGKGNLFALKRFDKFKRKVTNNLHSEGFCLKADIRHYFDSIDHGVLLRVVRKKITDEKVIWLIEQILDNLPIGKLGGGRTAFTKGMPLGNLTSQFFANVYLNELDYFVKHTLKAKHYIRYVDDFVILHKSKTQLKIWKVLVNDFLKEKLKLELHPDKSKVIFLSKGVDFVGFRNFYYFRLLRKRNVRKMIVKICKYKKDEINHDKILESFQGWDAYAKWADSFKLRGNVAKRIYR